MGHIIYLPVVITIATGWLLLLTTTLVPESDASQSLKDLLKFPGSLDELKTITSGLLDFQKSHPVYVFILFCSAYLFKQSFAIPGSVFLNLLSGALYGPVFGTIMCCVLTSVGASSCYTLSLVSGSKALLKKWPEKLIWLQTQVETNKDRLPYFLISLRLVPVTPNWFINVTSPMLGIPIKIFAFTALIGLIPYNFMCVQAGSVLSELKSVNDLLSFQTVCNLLLLAGVAALPGLLNKKLQKVS